MRARSLFIALALAAGCSYRPARFADRPPAGEVSDMHPIPLPPRTPFIEPVYLSDVYLRRPLADALDAERYPHAADVNSFDEVPRSSWWQPLPLEVEALERSYAVTGPPVPPLRAVEAASEVVRVRDARGRSFVVRTDPANAPKTRAPAAAIASRLVHALGYFTPEVWLTPDGDAALHWPVGITLGPTAGSGTRPRDDNDRILHENRRTLRALGVVAAWLDLDDLGPSRLLDVYVGSPPEGHVRHFVVGLHAALGASSFGSGKPDETAAGIVRGDALTNLWTLGLARPPRARPNPERTLRALSSDVPTELRLARPFEPALRLLPADGYWIAKRIAALPGAFIERAVACGELEPEVSAHVIQALEARRRTIARRFMNGVTPLEHVALERGLLELEDRAITLGHAGAGNTRYQVRFLDDAGALVHGELWVRPSRSRVAIGLPPSVLAEPYFVVQVVAWRGAVELPRAFEAHVSTRGTPHVVGLRH